MDLQHKFTRLLTFPYRYFRVQVGEVATTITLNGKEIKLAADSLEEYGHIELFKQHETRAVETVCGLLRDDDIFLDVGANIGIFSIAAAMTATEGEVLAFEPHTTNRQRLERHVELNSPSAPIRVFESALSDTDGEMTFTEEEGDVAGHGTAQLDRTGRNTVSTKKFDNMVKSGDVPEPNIIKIDIEGGEWNALNGMKETLASDSVRGIVVEIHPEQLPDSISPTEIDELLESFGFDVRTLSEEHFGQVQKVATRE